MEEVLLGSREEHLEMLRNLRLIDDDFMTKVFEDKECAQLLLRVILNRDDLTVVNVATQWEIKNLQGKSIILDIYAVDKEGKRYDVEIQRDNEGAEPRRARYNGSLMDANSLQAGQDVKELPENYVVFITENDVLGGKKPIYTIERMVTELDKALFNDGLHIIYVNGTIRDDTVLGRLMHDFFCTDPREMHNEVLVNRTKYFKETKEGVETMCKIMEDYGDRREARGEARGKTIGKKESSKEFALKLWNDGIRDIERIVRLTGLSSDEVKKLIESNSN